MWLGAAEMPQVLPLNGHHGNIKKMAGANNLCRHAAARPDLWAQAELTADKEKSLDKTLEGPPENIFCEKNLMNVFGRKPIYLAN